MASPCPVCKRNAVELQDGYLVCTDCSFYRKKLPFFRGILAWADAQSGWWWRTPVFLWFIFVFMQHLREHAFPLNRMANIFSALDFGMHELGHVLFIPLGQFMTILGGSLFQCIFPLLWIVAFTLKRWYFAAALSICWFGFNLYDVAVYVGDARDRLLPLATFSSGYDDAHDWYQILSRLDALHLDKQIAADLRVAGTISILIGLGIAGFLLARMLLRALQHVGHDEPTEN